MKEKIDPKPLFLINSMLSNSRTRLLSDLESGVFGDKFGDKRVPKKTAQQPLIIFTPNPEQLVQAHHDQSFYYNLKQADLLIPDGVGLVWASRLLALRGKGQRIKERISGIDLVQDLLDLAKKRKLKVLVVGGKNYQAAIVERQAKQPEFIGRMTVIPQLPAKLHWTPAFQDASKPTPKEQTALVGLIKKLRPEIVFVAFGAPQQESWVIEQRGLLASAGVKLAMVVGGSFDVILGKVPRAPQWPQQLGLEWLYRLWWEPWRWRRQLRLLEFAWLVLREWLSNHG